MDNDKAQQIREHYYFGAFRLDASERRLFCSDEPISLSPKQFDLLFYFVSNAGRVATKDELLDAVWSESYVAENTLARNVSWLRKELEACSGGERIIETVPKFGYRFAAEISRSGDEENALIIEEQTVQHILAEETIEFDEGFAEKPAQEYQSIGEVALAQENQSNGDVALAKVSRYPVIRSAASPVFLTLIALIVIIGSGFVLYKNYRENRSTTAIVTSPVVPFSGAAGYENTPAFSPDGRQIAYSWNGGEGVESDIYVKLTGTGAPLQLTKTEANEHYPAFSPDSDQIAFIRGKYGEPGDLILIPSLGGTEQHIARLFSGNYSISFSPDGQSIAVIDTIDSKPGGQHAVFIIDINNGERRRVTAAGDFLGETSPRFSPDGNTLAFIRVFNENIHARNTGRQDLFVVPVSGGEPRQITFDGVIINSLAWSADGEHIYFVPVRPPDQTVLRRVPASGGTQEIVSTGSKDITNIAVSPDGNTLVFAEDVRSWSIWRVPADGQTGESLTDSDFTEYFPQFSPDSARIAFQTDRSGISQIWTADTDGKDLRQITDMPASASSPAFSPDGLLIAFNYKNGEDFANYIIPANGGAPRRISVEGAQEDFPVWSADGRHIYFTSNRSGERDIWKMNADGTGEAVRITNVGAYRATPAPDGKTVYFTKTGFPRQFWRVSSEGGAEELLPEFEAAGFYNTWTMTKRGIYFIVPVADQNFEMKFYDFADEKIKDAPAEYKIPPNLDGNIIAFDGKTFLCTVLEKSSRLMLADLP